MLGPRDAAPASARREAVQNHLTTHAKTSLDTRLRIRRGLPALIGIRDLAKPDYGVALPVAADELPVFWACGLTTHEAVQAARPRLCITPVSAHMLVTDLRLADIAAY
jgi:uncharacterized protein YcsI (UPF0317 family)